MTSHSLILVLAGALAVAAIGFTMILGHMGQVPAPGLLAMLLATYAAGLGLGRLMLGAKG